MQIRLDTYSHVLLLLLPVFIFALRDVKNTRVILDGTLVHTDASSGSLITWYPSLQV